MPDEAVREIHCEVRGIVLEGRGDARLADYMQKVGFQEVGFARLYETMVFHAGKPCEATGCACGLPELAGHLETHGYNTSAGAVDGHMDLCSRYAKASSQGVRQKPLSGGDSRP